MAVSHVYDTYAKTTQGQTIHFDVVIDEKNHAKALNHAKEWLTSIGLEDALIDQHNCTFCHSAKETPEVRRQIDNLGYGIYKLDGCPS